MNKTLILNGTYQVNADVKPEQKFRCGKTGIERKYGEVTAAEVEKIIAAGSKHFSKVEPEASSAAKTKN